MWTHTLVDLENINCMRTPARLATITCVMCDVIGASVRYAQHSLNVVKEVKAEDMIMEKKKYYSTELLSSVIILNRTSE